ncbi:MAG: sensor histidine kinase [Armatimonadetes bacterium]|nr:sensor histidine kinase [Armatimonadota bacterium]
MFFHTQPPGARIFLETSGNQGGDYIGLAGEPIRLDLDRFRGAGSFDVRFQLDGHRAEVRNVKSHYFRGRERFPADGVVRLEPDNTVVAVIDLVRYSPRFLVAVTALLAAATLALAATRRRLREADRAELAIADREHQIRSLMDRIVVATESGRRAVANDLHDGLLQYLVAAEMHLAALGEDIGEGEPVEDLTKARSRLRSAVEEGRRLIRNLRPIALEELGLKRALEKLAREMAADEKWRLELHLDLPEPLSSENDVTVFRIAQEALSNVRKHARAKRVLLSVSEDGKELALIVHDWGLGFDVQERLGKGIGTQSMRERAELAGGTLLIRSRPGEGTVVEATIPVLHQKTSRSRRV